MSGLHVSGPCGLLPWDGCLLCAPGGRCKGIPAHHQGKEGGERVLRGGYCRAVSSAPV